MLILGSARDNLRAVDAFFVVSSMVPPFVGGLVLNSRHPLHAIRVGLAGYIGVVLVRSFDFFVGGVLHAVIGVEPYEWFLFVLGAPIGIAIYCIVTFLLAQIRMPWRKNLRPAAQPA
ncbi:MAG TPA: hypothetical protein VF660_09790 [Actinomycetota bacterium]